MGDEQLRGHREAGDRDDDREDRDRAVRRPVSVRGVMSAA